MNSLIETLNHWGGDFLRFAWPMLWQSSLLMTVLLAFDFLLRRRIRASIRYALWLVVLVKLCLPPALALPTGAAWWLFPSKAASQKAPVTKYVVTYDATAPATDSLPQIIPAIMPSPAKLDGAGGTLLGCGFVSAGLLLWLAFRWWQISRKVGCATASADLAGLLDEIRGRAGLRSPLRLKLVNGQMSPAVCGLFHPVILLPRVLVEQLSAAQLRAVLLHEAFHLRRKDVWVNCAQALLQIVYWWHPLLWLANARIRRLREEAVDDAVMLALRGEAESYAPTLLAVAKLAFSRPLMSLGLVGIMESRSALRKRIERLVNFSAPRKAGLTLLSLGGIFVFSAVALPMGQAPASAPDSLPADTASAETTLTVRVDPDVFIQNVKAQAAKSLLSPTNDYTDILLDLLRSEGVDCNPPHGIAFNTRTGEITTQNTPDRLAVFRQVIEQLNRADGICELPLHTNSLRKSVLIEARLYQMPAADFKSIASDLQFYPPSRGSDEWWSVSPEKLKPFTGGLESSSLRPILRPRIQTGSGMPADIYIGTSPNSVDLECKPYAEEGFINLKIRGTIIANAAASGPFTNHFIVEASAQDGGGIVICVENFDGYAGSNLVAVINMEFVTNAPPANFQERLRVIMHQANESTPINLGKTEIVPDQAVNAVPRRLATATNPSDPTSPDATSATDLIRDGKLLYEMGKLDEAEQRLKSALAEDSDNQAARYYMNLVQAAKAGQRAGIVQTQPGRKIVMKELNRIHLDSVYYDGLPLSEVIRQLSEQARLRDPEKKGINFLFNPNTDNSDTSEAAAAAIPVDQVLIKLNLTNVCMADLLDAIVTVADHPIKYSIVDDGVVFSPGKSQLLHMRTFKVDPAIFISGLRQLGDTSAAINETTNSGAAVSKMAASFFSKLGVDFESPSGKSVFYNDKLGLLFVKATESDLDTIERAIPALNATAPQIHIKARFAEVPKQGFVWPAADTNGPANQATEILNDQQTRYALKMLEAKRGFKILAEPEVVTTSGRQTQIQAIMTKQDVVYDVVVHRPLGTVTVLDTVATVLPDGYTIDLKTTATVTNLVGSADPTDSSPHLVTKPAGEETNLPTAQPRTHVYQAITHLRMWDDQTIVLGNLPAKSFVNGKDAGSNPDEQDKLIVVFITVTIVDPAGNRVHTDDEMPFAQDGIPPQPQK